MKVAGAKFCGHDSGLTVIDFDKKGIFAIDTERITRIKHDYSDVTPIIENYPDEFRNIEVVGNSVSDSKQDWSDYGEYVYWGAQIDALLRRSLKPAYIRELSQIYKKKMVSFVKFIFNTPHLLPSLLMLSVKYILTKKKPSNKLFADKLKELIKDTSVIHYDHHLCHSASSYYMSGVYPDEALCVSFDGYGDGFSNKTYIFKGDHYKYLTGTKTAIVPKSNPAFNKRLSLGIIYSNFTAALGFTPNSDEGKVEALAAYGNHENYVYDDLTVSITALNGELIFTDIEKFYDLNYFTCAADTLSREDIAAAIQVFLEKIVVKVLDQTYEMNPVPNLCLSGGVAANVIMNLKIFEECKFKNIFVTPPMNDSGLSLGAAILASRDLKCDLSWLAGYQNGMPYFGHKITTTEIEIAIQKHGSSIVSSKLSNEKSFEQITNLLIEGKIGAICRDKMEFGPRALGNRSIIAIPNSEARDKINKTIKRRPKFQPFCPSVLEEERDRLFEDSFQNKHMTYAFRIKEEFKNAIPSAMHIDRTARPQFVTLEDNSFLYNLLLEVKQQTGYGILINTSFNLHGRTMVRTAEDAIVDFIDCNLDFMVLGDRLIEIRKN